MTKLNDQTFMLTSILVSTLYSQTRIPQSALETVRSVECGLFA